MPKAQKDAFKGLTLDEQRFVFHFLRESVSSENENEQIRWAERKSRIVQGMGEKFLKREHVQQEIQRRRAQVELEQARLIARDQAKLAAEEDKRKTVTLDKLEAALDGVVNLDPEKHGGTVLEAIRLGLVYTGTINDGNRKRVVPADPTTQENSPAGEGGFYQSIFHGMRQGEVPADAMPLMPEETPAALMPDQPAPRPPVLRVNEPPAPAPPSAGNPKSKKSLLEIRIT
jgi:hypothetical protein